MKILDSIRERVARAGLRRTEKLLKTNSIKRTSKIDYSEAHSIKAGMDGIRFAIVSTMPFDLVSKAKVDEVNKALKVLKAKDAYKK